MLIRMRDLFEGISNLGGPHEGGEFRDLELIQFPAAILLLLLDLRHDPNDKTLISGLCDAIRTDKEPSPVRTLNYTMG